MITRAAARGLALDGLGEHWHGKHGHNEPDPLDRSQRLEGIIIGYAGPDERAYPAALDALVRVLSVP